jgi:hypothetical protein
MDTDTISCPACGTDLSQPDAAPYCLTCGWLPLAEIERQLRYWEWRKRQALARPNGPIVASDRAVYSPWPGSQ